MQTTHSQPITKKGFMLLVKNISPFTVCSYQGTTKRMFLSGPEAKNTELYLLGYLGDNLPFKMVTQE